MEKMGVGRPKEEITSVFIIRKFYNISKTKILK